MSYFTYCYIKAKKCGRHSKGYETLIKSHFLRGLILGRSLNPDQTGHGCRFFPRHPPAQPPGDWSLSPRPSL
ncbi:Uncharacterised protein [Vibrio cholerae]|nr:Uncharacterised protein [Vibrio cholerae]CSB97424.1 Uncharacterised protein [Vibrio cholerae]CSC92421.1 Uncharacterised protein [Vibrio cholerae]